MLVEISLHGLDVSGRTFNAGKRYGSKSNCEEMFQMDISPNIRQRKGTANRSKPNKGKAAMMFNSSGHRWRPLIEGAFGAEETRRHQLHCRFVRQDNRRRFAKGRSTARSIRTPNQFECATVPAYRFRPSAWRVRSAPDVLPVQS